MPRNQSTRARLRHAAVVCASMGASVAGAQLPAAPDSPVSTPRNPPESPFAAGPAFDAEILRERGLNPGIAEYFRIARGFTAGAQPVQVTLNGTELGRKPALFDADGRMCFTAEFVQMVGLLPGDGSLGPSPREPKSRLLSPAEPCPDYHDFSPRVLVDLQPSNSAVEITVPADYVQAVPRAYRTEYGGRGGMLNYRAYTLDSQASDGGGNAYRYRYLDTTLGFNVADWIFRSRQDFSRSSATTSSAWRSAYAQKTFESQKQVLQMGRVTTQDPLFGGLPITGAQWFPEQALYTLDAAYAVRGVADSRARIEIRQNDTLLYNTVVPPGPFAISEYPLQNRNADLQVKVIEENGSVKIFTVPASSLLMSTSVARYDGWNIAAGTFLDQTREHVFRSAPLASASHGWAGELISGTAGGVVSSRFVGAGVSAGMALPGQRSQLYGQLLASHDGARNLKGLLASAAAGHTFGTDVQWGVNGNLRTARYRSVQEALAYQQGTLSTSSGYRSQIGSTLAWALGAWGSMSAGISREDYFYGDPGRIVTLNWNKSWSHGVSLNFGISHRTARLSPLEVRDVQMGETRLAGSNYAYVNLSIPLGAGITSRSYVHRADGVDRLSTGIDQRINEFFGYRASMEQVRGEGGGDNRGANLSVYGTPYYTSLGAGVSRVRNYESRYAEASGGVVVTSDGAAFSPYPIQDNFGTLRTGSVVGARIETMQGPVWSGPGGIAALGGLPAYRETRMELGGNSIPLDIEVYNGLQVVQASRGAVVLLKMEMQRVRRLLLVVSRPDGTPLPTGSTLLRGDDYVGSSSERGRVLISNLAPGDVFRVELPDGNRCSIENIVPQKQANGDLFEKALAQCI